MDERQAPVRTGQAYPEGIQQELIAESGQVVAGSTTAGTYCLQIQEIAWDLIEQMNQRIEPGWTEWKADINQNGFAVYSRRTIMEKR